MVNEMWKIDTAKKNIFALMKPYHHGIISMILESKTALGTGDLHQQLNDEGFIVSRASVINYCKLLAANDVISFKEVTGKGGYRREYAKSMSWDSILEFIHMQVLARMKFVFPGSIYLNDVVGLLNK